MREILFRGQRVDNGEWAYGAFVPDALESTNGVSVLDGFIRWFDPGKRKMETLEVDRETVGQYTGLNDRNGVKIFEGDVVEYQLDNDDCPFPNKHTEKIIGRVFFSGHRASFSVTAGRNGSSMINNDLFRYVRGGNRVKVIGNVHDNPELLEESPQ